MKIDKILWLGLIGCFCYNTANAQSFSSEYQNFKNGLNKKYGFDYSIDLSVLEQRSSPNGENNAVQGYLYPSFSWTMMDNENGTGVLNFAYTVIRYGNHDANDLANNSGFVTPINDYPDNENELCYLGITVEAWDEFKVRDEDRTYLSDITIVESPEGVVTNGTTITFQVGMTFNFYINKTTHEVRIVIVE